jgi:hypothetical protein
MQMKALKLTIVPVIAMTVLMASCSKEEKKTTTPTTTTPTNTAGPQPPMPAPSGNYLSGALISLQMKYTTQPAGAPYPVDLNSEMAMAIFYSTPGSATRVEAGTVSVNGINLDKNTDNSYFKWAYTGATPADLDFDKTSDWNVSGSSAVTAFSYNHSVDFPDYTGDVPTSVTKADGLKLTFNSSTLKGADSVYVVVAGGSQSFTKGYAANAGQITISSSDLKDLPTVSDNSAVLEICPFKYNEVVKNGKNYFFIKEQAIVKSVNIN